MTAYDYTMGRKNESGTRKNFKKKQHINGIQFHPKTNSVSNRNQLVS